MQLWAVRTLWFMAVHQQLPPRQPRSWWMGLQPEALLQRRAWTNRLDTLLPPTYLLTNKKTTYCAPRNLLDIFLGSFSCNPRVSWICPEPGVKTGSHALRQPPPGVSLMSTAKKPCSVASPCLSVSVVLLMFVSRLCLLFRGWWGRGNPARKCPTGLTDLR